MADLKNNLFKNDIFKLSCMIIGYFFSVLFIFNIFMLLNINHSLMIVNIISILIPAILFVYFSKNIDRKKTVFVLAVYLFMVVALPFAFGRTYDLTIDGNSYHKTAIGYIKDGWNPIYESSKEFQKSNDVPQTEKIDLWIDHYPKSSWIIGATIYSMTDNIESGKSLTFNLLAAMFFMTYSVLLVFLPKWKALLISLVSILNPIVLVQLFNYYVDGLVGICFAFQLILLLIMKPEEKQNNLLWFLLAAIVSLFVNLKFTGLLYSGILAATFYFYWIIKLRKEKYFFKKFRDITIRFIIVFGIAIFMIGSSSYVKNTIEHKNPLYPLIGKDKVDIVSTMQPKKFGEITSLEKFTLSLFSKTENVTYYSGDPKLKIPFMVYRSEIESLSLPDTRIGGFGPWFAMVFLVSIITGSICVYKLFKIDKKKLINIIVPMIAIIISIIAVGENWWARYVPQLYLVPIIALIILAYTIDKTHDNKLYKIFFVTLLSIMFINASFCLYTKKSEINTFIQIRNDLSTMALMPDLKLQLSEKQLYGLYYNLRDYGISYKYVDYIKEENIRYMYSWRIKVDTEE